MYKKANSSYILAILAFLLLPFTGLKGQVSFLPQSSFSYLKGSQAGALDAGWMNAGFDDSGWSTGSAPFRYGDGEGGTLLSDMRHSYSVLYLRSTFTATNADLIDRINLYVDYDDGFVIWINGHEVVRRNAPAVLSNETFATEMHEFENPEEFNIDPGSAMLVDGENALAIQVFNISLESSDLYLDMALFAEITEPVFQDSVGLLFSVPSGFYQDPFTLDITPADPGWTVYYTLDGSNPQDSETAIESPGGASVLIDPKSIDHRDLTPAVIIRASSGNGEIKPSHPEARTYIFEDDVLDQQYPGGKWPDYNVNGQIIDLEMDGRISYSPEYGSEMIPSLKDVPSISLVTDIDHLFDSQTGIYVNAWGHGYDWERECSVELIQNDDSEGFNANAGLRIRGGWSRHNDFPKHSFRLFFRSEYGDSKLNFPLFGDEGVDSYDKIDLRTSQNYAWANGDSRNTMLRDIFSRDTQRDMEQPYTRSRYYHLYLNGMYWGLFQTQERSEARFASDYFGGDAADYDVIKVNTEDWQYRIEATDGDLALWYEIWKKSQDGFASNEDYFFIEGKDASGEPLPGAQVYVEIDNLIDYMLSIFFTGNFDAPTSTFGSNRGPNNFFAINDRTDKSKGFIFFNHDAEHSIFSEPASPGKGLYEDRVNLATQDDGPRMYVSDFSAFHPQWLHYKLSSNAEYRIRFTDRATRMLNGNGVLTAEKNLERLSARAGEVETALIAESARWGDARRGSSEPYTRDDNWIPELNKIKDDFIPYRTNIVIDQLKSADLYSDLAAPQVSRDGTILEEDVLYVDGPSRLLIKNLNSSSTIYYTTDGNDPRKIGGGLSSGAVGGGTQEVEVNFTGSGILKSRIHMGGSWSAMKEIKLISSEQDYSGLVITELHYHPEELIINEDTTSSKDMEFIEFKNIGSEAISLGGLVLDSAVYYEFPEETILAPEDFYVVASKPSKFYLRYGIQASGNYSRNFSNGGEEILLEDGDGNEIIRFTYSDDPPWPSEPDGLGNSLVSAEKNPTGYPGDASYWTASQDIGGSPFADEPNPAHSGPAHSLDEELLVYPNPASEFLNIEIRGREEGRAASISLYGINGNLLHQEKFHGNTSLHLSNLNLISGVYLVRVQTESKVYTRKIVFR